MKKGHTIVRLALAVFLITGFASCDTLVKKKTEQPLARVFDKYLYPSDLVDAIPEGTSAHDSVIIAKRYIDTWIKKQLLLNRAEDALSDEQKDFDRKIEEYRTSLLIYSYRQKLLQQNMDTAVDNTEIEEYYNNNINNFILNSDIVKATFVKVPLSAPDIAQVRNWTRSGTEDDLDKLEKYSINYAEKFDTFGNKWIYFSTISDQIPLTIDQPGRYLRYNKNIETSDSLFHYFIHIYDHKTEGDIIPLELIRNDIKSILLNKRKIEFYNNLEMQVYNEGLNRNQFEIY